MESDSLTDRQRFWLDHYRHCRQQNQRYTDYCKAHDLSVAAFTYARGELRKRGLIESTPSEPADRSTGFVSVEVDTQPRLPNGSDDTALLKLPNQIVVQVPVQAPHTLLPQLLTGGGYDPSR